MEGDAKSFRDKAHLKGKRSDYILYDEDDEIVALIEAKKSADKVIIEGLAQCMNYAKLLGRKDIICFCTDGNIT